MSKGYYPHQFEVEADTETWPAPEVRQYALDEDAKAVAFGYEFADNPWPSLKLFGSYDVDGDAFESDIHAIEFAGQRYGKGWADEFSHAFVEAAYGAFDREIEYELRSEPHDESDWDLRYVTNDGDLG